MMFTKSFMALDGNERLTRARTAQTAPYDRYRCHLCGSAMTFHPEYHTERPWFEHLQNALIARGRQCLYVKPERVEMRRIKMVRRHMPDARPLVRKADWFCVGCNTLATLMKCANLDPHVKADARHSQLRRTVGGLAAHVAVRS